MGITLALHSQIWGLIVTDEWQGLFEPTGGPPDVVNVEKRLRASASVCSWNLTGEKS